MDDPSTGRVPWPNAECDPWPEATSGRRLLGWLLPAAGLIAVLLGPAIGDLVLHPPAPMPLAATVAGLAALVVLFVRLFARQGENLPGRHPVPRLELVALVAAAVALATHGSSWVPALALASLAVGLLTPRAVAGPVVTLLSALAGVLGWRSSDEALAAGTLLIAVAVLGGFGYLSRRNAETSAKLRVTQAELADLAVTEERLRIARELHDLLGHSLSLIALKAELAGNLLATDREGVRREIDDIESVARRSLVEVREAVSSYRQPTLAAELATARQSITTAGIEITVDAPADWSLPAEVESLLAWTVREGATNVIRHSQATTCSLRLGLDADAALVELVDDGIGPVLPGGGRDDPANDQVGTGLVGLAERTDRLGGQLDASATERGFRLRVSVPLQGSS